MLNEDIVAYYQKRMSRFEGHAEQCGWVSRFTQELRFEAVTSGWDLTSASLLDVGCGYGDLLGYLAKHHSNLRYTGVDLIPNFIDVAKKEHPSGTFIQGDFFDQQMSAYDYVLAIGTFNHATPNPYMHIKDALIHMFAHCKIAAGAAILSALSPPELRRSKAFFYYDPIKVFQIALQITPFVEFKTQYLPNDFSVTLYK